MKQPQHNNAPYSHEKKTTHTTAMAFHTYTLVIAASRNLLGRPEKLRLAQFYIIFVHSLFLSVKKRNQSTL